jgi:DNA-binding transcriptional LysR family regulator
MLDTRRLRVLVQVARQGSFSAAAETLGYTQPAISRQIATLEAEVGTQLVRRVPQGAVLTDAGRLLVERAETILVSLASAEEELRQLGGLEGGRLRFASFASAAASIMPLAVASFRDRHPAVELHVVMADPVDSLPRLRSGELDLALSHESLEQGDPAEAGPPTPTSDLRAGIEFVHLFDDPMYVVMPAAHPLAEEPNLALGRFASEPWMLATTDTCPDSRLFLRACHAAGFEPQIAFQNDDYPAIIGLVAAGVGVALIPDMATRGIRGDVVVRALDPPAPPRPILAAVPADYCAPAADAMLEILREVSEAWTAERPALAAA